MLPKDCQRWQRDLPSNIVFRHHGGALIRALTRDGFQDLIPGEEIPLLQCNSPLDLMKFLQGAIPCLLNQWEPEEKHFHHFHSEEGALVFLANHPHSVTPEHLVGRFFFEVPAPEFADLKEVAGHLEIPRPLGIWATIPRVLKGLPPLTRSQTTYRLPNILPLAPSIFVPTSWEEMETPKDTLTLTKVTITPYFVSDQDLPYSMLYQRYLEEHSLARRLFLISPNTPDEGETFCSATGEGVLAATEYGDRVALKTGVSLDILPKEATLKRAYCRHHAMSIAGEETAQVLNLLNAAPEMLGSPHIKGISNLQDLSKAWRMIERHDLLPERLLLSPEDYARLRTSKETSTEGVLGEDPTLWGVKMEMHLRIPPGRGFLLTEYLAGDFEEVTPLTDKGGYLEETYYMSLWDGRRVVVLDFEESFCLKSE